MAGGKIWTDDEVRILEECYKNRMSSSEMCKLLPNRKAGSIMSMGSKLGFAEKYKKTNHKNYKAEYQDYNWLFNKMVIEDKTISQISKETGYSVRVLEKWAYEKYNISNRTIRNMLTLNDIQKEIIIAGTLGDGHIDKHAPVYIESHAEYQKEYLYWKWNILKNIFHSEPTYKEPCRKIINGKLCDVQASYRMTSREVSELEQIRSISRIEKIRSLSELGISTHVLDDGYFNGTSWEICLAEWGEDEIDEYRNKLNSFGVQSKRCSDKRYIRINKDSSIILNEIILRNIPNDLDVIKNKHIKE